MEYNSSANELNDYQEGNSKYDMMSDSNESNITYINTKNIGKQYFPSNYNSLNITNAETGEIYTDIVGSNSEKKYFRVIDATGYANEKGQFTFGSRTPNKLFYKDAQQYINHRNRKYNISNNVNNV